VRATPHHQQRDRYEECLEGRTAAYERFLEAETVEELLDARRSLMTWEAMRKFLELATTMESPAGLCRRCRLPKQEQGHDKRCVWYGRTTSRDETGPLPLCICGHAVGWHFQRAGSCLECSCLGVRHVEG